MKIKTISAVIVVEINRKVCLDGNNRHQCYGIGRVESALHSAFYPGSYPFEHGGVAGVAGAMCYYLVKAHAFFDGNKRTAAVSSLVFMEENEWDLRYGEGESGQSMLAEVVDRCAAGAVSKEDLMEWFDRHKSALQPR